MDLGNSLEVVVHYLLIGGIASLGHQDGFPTVSALVCMVTCWTKPMVSHDMRLSNSHGFTKLFNYVISQSWENIEFVPNLAVDLTYK